MVEKKFKNVKIHQSALIGNNVSIGENTTIWANVYIGDNVKIGSNNIIGHGAFIDRNVIIGSRVSIHSYALIYDGVIIEDECFIGPAVCFTNDKYPKSGKKRDLTNVKWKVGKGSSIGANTTILPDINIGKNCLIGAGSLVNKDIPDNSKAFGNPIIFK
tara:strand:- start:148 stop:624 length:477 start_codon:yes stop_codon:yes gene_type:complete